MLLIAAAAARAQSAERLAAPLALTVGSADENYLRYAQTLGEVPLDAWTIRQLTPAQVRRLAELPTGFVAARSHRIGRVGAIEWQALPASTTVWYNTTYPFGWNDGAVWRGRGATLAADAGIAARWRWFSATIAPTVFVAENRDFALMPNGLASNPFADPRRPQNIDRPQRFGSSSYSRVDPGQTTLRADGFGFTAGISTANQWIGPMSEWPFILGNSAAGFTHVFAGSARPWNVWIGRIHGRIFYADLAESDYFDTPDSTSRRFSTGVAGSFMPRFIPGLEIGGMRMISYAWPKGGLGWKEFRKPFQAFLLRDVKGDPGRSFNFSADNQLASVFARWTAPESGFEVYGEFGRDDHSWNGRDVIAEPDHSAAYGLGARKAWRRHEGALNGLRVELLNLDPSTLGRARPGGQGSKYSHAGTRQGHTQRGQVMGAGFAAIDGGGTMVAWERFQPSGEYSTLSLSRMVMRERAPAPNVDVDYALGFERSRRRGPISLLYGATAVYEMNRYFQADVGNLLLTLGARW